jgi:Flp pilus assembly protein protease CpaA
VVLRDSCKGEVMAEIFLAGIVIGWLVACAVFDLRSRKVPNLLTLLPLAGAMVLASLRGNWPAAMLVVVFVVLSDLSNRLASVLSVLALVALGLVSCEVLGLPLDALLTQVILFVTWQLWLRKLTGGADAKILMTLTLLYGSGVFVAATMVGGLFGLAALLLKKRMLPYVLPITTGATAFIVLSLTKLI